jgi:simple sugar transport system ATP-binding protein
MATTMDKAAGETPLAVEMRGIVKRFPGVVANDNVDFELRRGEIHALLGENGAGKSTLMNVLGGLYKPEAGIIRVNGRLVSMSSPRDAIALGIGMVHQHFMLVPSQTVTENILLGMDKPAFFLRLPSFEDEIAALGEKFGLHVDPRAHIWQLSVGEQQRVELLKLLYRGAEILIMDEPTAVLGPAEIDELFKTLRNMIGQGKSIIFISHKLNEIQALADRVTVLRRGKVTAAGVPTAGASRADLARLMVGREVLFRLEKREQQPGEEALRVEELHAQNDRGLPALRGVSFTVHQGEIVGIAGVAGNGQSELAQVLTGLRSCSSGRVIANGRLVNNSSPAVAIGAGVAHIPEDRTGVGSAPNLSVTENVIMKNYRQPPLCHGWTINYPAAREHAVELKRAYEIAAPTVESPVRLLSGGNLQRVILAREISAEPKVMIAVQPTRGLDVGAIEGVQRLLLAQREAGAAILLISEELEEVVTLSDRVLVIFEGRIMGEVIDGDVDRIGLLMAGVSEGRPGEGEA